MNLKDISNGPDWLMWVVCVLFAVLSIVLLSGHGSGLIAGYNTASEQEKSRYDAKKLCRLTGAGMSVITVILFVMAAFQDKLPESAATVFMFVILIVCLVIVVLSRKICRK